MQVTDHNGTAFDIETDEEGNAKLKSIINFFSGPGEKPMAIGKEYQALSDESKADLKAGLGNGSLTY